MEREGAYRAAVVLGLVEASWAEVEMAMEVGEMAGEEAMEAAKMEAAANLVVVVGLGSA